MKEKRDTKKEVKKKGEGDSYYYGVYFLWV